MAAAKSRALPKADADFILIEVNSSGRDDLERFALESRLAFPFRAIPHRSKRGLLMLFFFMTSGVVSIRRILSAPRVGDLRTGREGLLEKQGLLRLRRT